MDRFKPEYAGIGLCKTVFAPNITGSEKRVCILKRCTRQPVLTAERNVKFHSSQTVLGQFTAESATRNEDHHADIKHLANILLRSKISIISSLFFISLLDSSIVNQNSSLLGKGLNVCFMSLCLCISTSSCQRYCSL